MPLIDHHSISSITTAMSCPRQWWGKYVLKLETVSGEAASFGSHFDQSVGAALKTKVHKEEKRQYLPNPDVEEAVRGYLSQPWSFKEAADSQYPINITPGQWGVIAEMHGLYSEIKYPIIGYIDLINRVERKLVDLKTSSAKRVSFYWPLQVLTYSEATQAQTAEIHLMTRTKVPAYYRILVPVTNESRKWAVQIVSYWIARIEEWLERGAGEELPRYPDYHCNWCAEALKCPAKNLTLEK